MPLEPAGRGERGRPAVAAALRCAALVLALGFRGALAQGQDAVTGTMSPQTLARPAPLLSSIASTTVPGGPAVEPLPIPAARPQERGGGLVLPDQVALAPPERLACGDIADRNARARCEGLSRKPSPPAEGAP